MTRNDMTHTTYAAVTNNNTNPNDCVVVEFACTMESYSDRLEYLKQ